MHIFRTHFCTQSSSDLAYLGALVVKFAENLQRDPRAEMLKSTENKAVLCPKVLSGKTSFGLC